MSGVIAYSFTSLVSFVLSFVTGLLAPIDDLILRYTPDVSNAFNKVGLLFDYISSSIGWAVSLSGIPQDTLSLIFLYFSFKLTAPLIVYAVKFAFKWFHYFKI